MTDQLRENKKSNKPRLKFIRKPGNPLYFQIKEDILARIEEGQWDENSKIPTEVDLCEEYGVSTITIREALKLLVKDGKLYRVAGKGTFVSKPKLEQKLNSLFSITHWAKQEGLTVTTRIIKIELQKCDSHIAHHLLIRKNEPVTRIERLRLGNNEPLMFEILWTPSHYCPDIHLQDMVNVSFHDILKNIYNIPLIKAIETIEPTMADNYIERLLGLDNKSLFLLVEHTTYTLNNKAVLFVRSFYRGDRYKFTIELKST